jgi:CubicO group peptidase (beta-lactamase class C family)
VSYFPPPGASAAWFRKRPEDLGLDPVRLTDAVAFAKSHDMPWPRDLTKVNVSNDKPPFDRKLGPMKSRGRPSGLVLKDGHIVAEWGEPERVDVTYSATKSYVSAVAGLAVDRGLIRSVDDPVCRYVNDGGFDSAQNSRVTWRSLLQQTSEWEGTLFGLPDTVDWNRRSAETAHLPIREARKAPGEHWEYNDVRVNRLALALLRIWNEPLPAVIRRLLMDPIGATNTWEWHGYAEHSMVTLNDGRRVESISGGAHWGGGLFINSYDHARFGLLFLNRGCWGPQRVVSEAWLNLMLQPCPRNPSYGFLWWLNTDHLRFGSAPESAFGALGAGGNAVVADPEHGTVTVTRWCSDVRGVVERVAAAFSRSSPRTP